jgi:FtsP/CotA-like multicopper oxidase with cupredoxin domain
MPGQRGRRPRIRRPFLTACVTGPVLPPSPGESGLEDTVIAYPAQVTRIRATFDMPGRYVWHCHILEHEDDVRPLHVRPGAGSAP